MSHYTPTRPEVSVLMAARDAGRTIRRAIESLQHQTNKNFELVVVDCGSTDDTSRQLSSLAERDLRINVVSAERISRQEALSLALARAQGTYVVVMDPEAWAEPEMLSDFVFAAEDNHLELVVGGFSLAVSMAGGHETELEVVSDEAIYPTQHEFRAAAWRYFASGQLLPVCAKLFLRSRIEELGLSFDASEGSDHPFVTRYLADVQRVGVLAETCYHMSCSIDSAEVACDLEGGYRFLEDEHTALLSLYHDWGLDGDAASMEMLQNRYVGALVCLIEGVCGWGTKVSAERQRMMVGEMINSPRAQLAASVAHPSDTLVRAMLGPIRMRSTALACAQARLLSLFRRGNFSSVSPDAFV